MTDAPPAAPALDNLVRDEIVGYIPQLRAFARSLVGSGRVDLADDLVQDTMLLALRGWSQFTPGTNLKAWLFRILHNRFHSVIRRKHVSHEIPAEHLEQRLTVAPEQESRLETEAFKRAFAQLSHVHREVLVMAGVHGMAYEEIAQICGCELGTVKSRVSRARALLKEILIGQERPPARAPAKAARPTKATRPIKAAQRPVPKRLVAAPPSPRTEPVRVKVTASEARQRHLGSMASSLATIEQRIIAAELQVALHYRITDRLTRIGAEAHGAKALLGLAERRVTLLQACRERLLDADAGPALQDVAQPV